MNDFPELYDEARTRAAARLIAFNRELFEYLVDVEFKKLREEQVSA